MSWSWHLGALCFVLCALCLVTKAPCLGLAWWLSARIARASAVCLCVCLVWRWMAQRRWWGSVQGEVCVAAFVGQLLLGAEVTALVPTHAHSKQQSSISSNRRKRDRLICVGSSVELLRCPAPENGDKKVGWRNDALFLHQVF